MGSTTQDKNDYHQHVPPKGLLRFLDEITTDPYAYSEQVRNGPIFPAIWAQWQGNLSQPFRGITNDGTKREGIYSLQDEGAPVTEMVTAARNALEALSPDQRQKASLDLDSEDWRKWCNPEIIVHDLGVRLEHLRQAQVDLIMEVLRKSLSEVGFAKSRGAMKANKFLGEICHRQPILNEGSFFFFISGTPSEQEPWGFTFFGHHLVLNIFVVGSQMTIGPAFIGAEPNIIDSGPDAGTELCTKEAALGLHLMQSLGAELQRKAQIYCEMHDPGMPPGRWNFADQRHVAGAFQDNRIIPYEGVVATCMTDQQQSALLSIAAAFLELLPKQPLEHRLRQIREHLSETYFSWIGGFTDDDAFYYRIQSPVVLLEFDHHSGVFLTNQEPAKYHIHTIIRTPNGNDYGRELIRQYREGATQ
ncbi:hypothetical protein EDB81DRAFT_950121 [Dactylonectria macrodidyma]|uniref:DUF3500 domain-containing protein n=1 Tax=Dactylonectria macrodidyma TaxID=307937 RepID=A0A9P9EAM3_9HYPO|nr:hypothetical protein EDB81DRAFT_950121 [Dactylonectria macrodidyma]